MENEKLAKEKFDKFDLDKSGMISAKEWVCVMLALGKSDEEAKDIVTVSLTDRIYNIQLPHDIHGLYNKT